MFPFRRPNLLLSAIFTLTVLTGVAPLRAQAEGQRIAVVPFAALNGDIPNRAGTKAAGMLSTELKNTQGVQLVVAPPSPDADPAKDAVLRARNLVEEAKGLRDQKKFRLAEEALQKALTDFRTAASELETVEELADTYALLSAVQYVTGQDEKGQVSLDLALGLVGRNELALQKTSALFSKVVEERRKVIAAAPKGQLLIESTPSGAAVFMDGVAVGNAPVVVKDVPPGVHLWRVRLPTGDMSGGAVEISSGKETKVAGRVTATDAQSRIISSLAQNTLDAAAVTAAQEHAKSINADLVIVGALSRQGKGLAMDAFLLTASSGELKRLPRKTFDNELLSAGMEFYNLAGELAKQGNAIGEAAKAPVAVAQGNVSQPKLTEAVYGAADKANDLVESVSGSEPEKKREPLKRKPLTKQK